MDDLSRLLDVVALLHDSVLDEERWTEALDATTRYTSGHAFAFVAANPTAGLMTQCDTHGIDPDFQKAYLGHYAAREVRLAPALRYSVGEVLVEEMLVRKRDYERSEIYNELLLPFGVPHHMFAWLRKAPDEFQTVAIQRTASRGAFEAEDIRRFAALVPHLQKTVELRRAFAELRTAKAAYLGAIERLPFGVALLNPSGQVLEMNTAFNRMLSRTRALTVRANRLAAWRREEDVALQGALRGGGTDETLTVDAGGQPVRLSVLPLRPSANQTLASHPATLVLAFTSGADTNRQAIIQAQLGISRAEAALVEVLFEGVTLKEAADRLGVSVNTCKTQLKSVYAKTGCRTHVQLVRRLMAATFVEL